MSCLAFAWNETSRECYIYQVDAYENTVSAPGVTYTALYNCTISKYNCPIGKCNCTIGKCNCTVSKCNCKATVWKFEYIGSRYLEKIADAQRGVRGWGGGGYWVKRYSCLGRCLAKKCWCPEGEEGTETCTLSIRFKWSSNSDSVAWWEWKMKRLFSTHDRSTVQNIQASLKLHYQMLADVAIMIYICTCQFETLPWPWRKTWVFKKLHAMLGLPHISPASSFPVTT